MMRDPKMILVIEDERQAAVLENACLRDELILLGDKCSTAVWSRDHERSDNEKLRAELANARLERDNIASLNSSLIAELAAISVERDRLVSIGHSVAEERDEFRAELAEEQLIEAYAGANLLAADVIRFRDRQLAAEARAERAEAELDAMREAGKAFLVHMQEQGYVVSRRAIDLARKVDAALAPSHAGEKT